MIVVTVVSYILAMLTFTPLKCLFEHYFGISTKVELRKTKFIEILNPLYEIAAQSYIFLVRFFHMFPFLQ